MVSSALLPVGTVNHSDNLAGSSQTGSSRDVGQTLDTADARKVHIAKALQERFTTALRDRYEIITLSRDAYLPHEWEEPADWFVTVQMNINFTMMRNLNICDFGMAQLIKDRNLPVSDKAGLDAHVQNLPVHYGHHYQVDCDGEWLALFLKGGLTWPWPKDQAAKLFDIPLKATMALTETYPPPMIKDGNKRHPDRIAERKKCEEEGQPHGVYYLGARRSMGKHNQQPTLTSETWPDTEKGETVNKYFRDIAPMDQTLGMLLEAFDKLIYDRYREMYDWWAERSALNGLKRTGRACWTFRAILVNARVASHRDDLDLQGGVVAMTCAGEFEGGRLILPALGIQYDFKPGDVMFCKASLLEHAIGPWKGTRVSMVGTWKSDMTNLNVANPFPTVAKRSQQAADRKVKYAPDEANGTLRHCPFCHRPSRNLKVHLHAWRKDPPKANDKHHDAEAIRAWARENWD